jgi:hypothetical protein
VDEFNNKIRSQKASGAFPLNKVFLYNMQLYAQIMQKYLSYSLEVFWYADVTF